MCPPLAPAGDGLFLLGCIVQSTRPCVPAAILKWAVFYSHTGDVPRSPRLSPYYGVGISFPAIHATPPTRRTRRGRGHRWRDPR